MARVLKKSRGSMALSEVDYTNGFSVMAVAKTRKSGIIIGVMSFAGNPFDGDTLSPQLAQVERIAGYQPETGIVDRGYRGRKQISGTQIICPGNHPKATANAKGKKYGNSSGPGPG